MVSIANDTEQARSILCYPVLFAFKSFGKSSFHGYINKALTASNSLRATKGSMEKYFMAWLPLRSSTTRTIFSTESYISQNSKKEKQEINDERLIKLPLYKRQAVQESLIWK
ncbi:predicted protein [Sclerotinia sclerotiorum 1980 UF-70]|uniref:Uncharacterized protein n=1 Tax=Sclerotinia sclerotiorum (strain ATCC 18683 / 1980 / Ss-1) TaxID=665079 RepID=A7F3U3_SCLS1|nr:predicted protein [Sclerotinia sclerotiorum 1980 UF-70]EDN97414.1 predicted protein [Sclerotinia sclerotiorum 1980 UF-70]